MESCFLISNCNTKLNHVHSQIPRWLQLHNSTEVIINWNNPLIISLHLNIKSKFLLVYILSAFVRVLWVWKGKVNVACVSESPINLKQPIKQRQTLVAQASRGWYSVCQIGVPSSALIILSINRHASLCFVFYVSAFTAAITIGGLYFMTIHPPNFSHSHPLFLVHVLSLFFSGTIPLWWRVKEHVV